MAIHHDIFNIPKVTPDQMSKAMGSDPASDTGDELDKVLNDIANDYGFYEDDLFTVINPDAKAALQALIAAQVTAARIDEAKLWNEQLATKTYDEYSTGIANSEPNKWFIEWAGNHLAELKKGATE